MMQNQSQATSDSSNSQNPSSINNEIENLQEVNSIHRCNYCFKTFSTPQALGGHQNAHRRQKDEAKWARRRLANSNRSASRSRANLSARNHHGGDGRSEHSTTSMFNPVIQYEPQVRPQYLQNPAPSYGFIPVMRVPVVGNPNYFPYPPAVEGAAWNSQPRELNLLGQVGQKLMDEEENANANGEHSESLDLNLKL